MKLLVVIATYGTNNNKYIQRLIKEYRSMAFHVDIVVLSNIPQEIADGVEVVVVPRRRVPWRRKGTFDGQRSLRFLRQEYRDWVRHLDIPFVHRQIFAERQNDYDLFLYSEDDTLVRETNLQAFLSATKVLNRHEIAGFLRFELGEDGRWNYPEIHGHFHWEPSSVRRRGEHTFACLSNEHAACYLITRDQLLGAIKSGGFAVSPHGGKYDLLCTAATDIYTQCGFEKVICISNLDSFLVHHLPNRYVGTQFGVDDAELRRQVAKLLEIGKNGDRSQQLVPNETRLTDRSYSKGYYEPISTEVISAVPAGVETLLSVGTGWGAVEGCLSSKGIRVAGIPLDPVIAGRAEDAGIEIVSGSLEEASAKVADRRFDCLLLSNVLHLVPDPVRVLRLFAGVLSSGGTAIALVPNTSRLESCVSAVVGGRLDDLGMYGRTGVQRTSQGTVCGWFESAGFEMKSVRLVLGPQAGKFGRLTKGIVNSWLASEFLVVASLHGNSEAERGSTVLHEAGLRS